MWFQRLVPQMCFLALVGCLRPTTDFETLSKDPKWVFWFAKAKYSGLMAINMFILLNFPLVRSNNHFWSLLRASESVVGLKQPTKARKHIGGAVDLYAPEEKYIDLPLSAVKTQCLRKPFFL